MPAKQLPKDGVTRKRDAERTRVSILNAATKEFSLHGYSGSRIDKIVARAKCNIRLLYHHFGSKKALYLEVLESAYEDLRRNESKIKIDIDDPLGSVERLLHLTFIYFEKNRYFEGLLLNENLMQGRFVRRLKQVPEAADALRETLAALISAGEKQGVFREGLDPVQLYVTITALSRFHIANEYTLSAVLRTDLRDQNWREARLEHCTAVLRSYLTDKRKD